MKRDLVSLAFWSREDLLNLFTLADDLLGAPSRTPLAGASAALVFERLSLRTRVSFEVGVAQLGGHPIFLQQETIGMSTRESVHDTATTLSRYCSLIIARTVRHQTCVQLAESATIPVINALTDLVHPCQILADAYTLIQHERFSRAVRLVYIGDGNNIANSWLELSTRFPLHLVFSCPTGYEPHPRMVEDAQSSGISTVEFIPDPREAIRNADVVYTDIWPGGGSGEDEGRRLHVFKPYQVNKTLMGLARPDCLVMHRLPANRGEEITSDVLDGKHAVALEQARNRLTIQNAIMTTLVSS
jgi:ornithine carbamoyltransferase